MDQVMPNTGQKVAFANPRTPNSDDIHGLLDKRARAQTR